ncbi:MAG: hypothetical protein ACRELS_02225, partial [Candidatus Rokuibacteriota bacterium]
MSADRGALRNLPSVDELVRLLAADAGLATFPRARLTALAREAVDAERQRVLTEAVEPVDALTLA